MKRKEVIFFDVDDTLYDHTFAAEYALKFLIEHIPAFGTTSYSHLHHLYVTLLEEAHAKLLSGVLNHAESVEYRWTNIIAGTTQDPHPDWRSVSETYRKAYLNAERSVPGALELVRRLRNDFRLGIITNNRVSEQIGKLTRCRMLGLFDVMAISEAVGAVKPDRRIFDHALREAGIEAGEALMIGDSVHSDIEGARHIGMNVLWFNRSGHASPEHRSIPAIASFEPLEAAVDSILSQIDHT